MDPQSPSVRGQTATTLELGVRLGRFTVTRLLGAGGMGAVYAAQDPELDRTVALKVLDGERRADDRFRLLREAQALARLAHPNVVSVFEVGQSADHLFIAMEHIDGVTLKEHLAARPRPWHEIVGLFVQAGRGLAAAHARGLVHRDFKPSNVLVDAEGRARVSDFGLARLPGETGGGEAPPGVHDADTIESPDLGEPVADAIPPGSLLDLPLTRADAFIGTPHYMSPEQRARLPATTRSDQYSFCLSLWEAVFGAPPPKRARRAPRWLARALEIGLDAEPMRRHPSMDVLLQVLEGTPVRRRRVAAAVLGLVVAGAAVALAYPTAARDELCRDAATHLAGVWDAPRRASLRAAFAATGAPLAGDAAAAVEAALDAYATHWITAHTEACEATHRHGEQSVAMLDLRMACLGDRLEDARALVDTLERADRQTVGRAADAAHRLRGVDACADSGWLTARVAPPEDPAVRALVDDARARLARFRALVDTGQTQAASKLIVETIARSAALPYSPLQAELALARGQDTTADMATMERTLFEAGTTAIRVRHDEVAMRAALELGWRLGERDERTDEGLRWLTYAQALLDRLGGDPETQVVLLRNRGAVLRVARRSDEAIADLRRAVAIAESLGDATLVARAENELGVAVSTAGREAEAVTHFQHCVDTWTRVEGPLGRSTLVASFHLATALRRSGRLAEGLALQEQTLAAQIDVLGADHSDVGVASINLGNTLELLGRCSEALPHFQRALAVYQKLDEEVRIGHAFRTLSRCQRQVGDLDAALASAHRALEIAERRKGGDPDHLVLSLVRVGEALTALGRLDEAEAAYRRALDGTEGVPPAKLRDGQVFALRGLARVVGKRDPREALGYVERALASGRTRDNKDQLAASLGAMGEALAALGEHARARAAFEEALATLSAGAYPADRARWEAALSGLK